MKKSELPQKIRGTAKNQSYHKKSELPQKIRATAKNQRYRKKSEVPQKIRNRDSRGHRSHHSLVAAMTKSKRKASTSSSIIKCQTCK